MSSEAEKDAEQSPPTKSTNIPWVPPRIDPDLYQADVPEWQPPGKIDRKKDNYESQCTNRAEFSAEVKDFIVKVRNMFDSINPSVSASVDGRWSADCVYVPDESDAATLEFLSKYDNDVDKAWFALSCQLSCGKDTVFTSRTLNYTSRLPSSLVYVEGKDRILKKEKNLIQGSLHTSKTKDLSMVINKLEPNWDIYQDLLSDEEKSRLLLGKVENEEKELESEKNDDDEEKNEIEDNPVANRSRIQSDKQMEKKRWVEMVKNASAMLSRCAKKSKYQNTDNNDETGKTVSGKSRRLKERSGVDEAQELLDSACGLGVEGESGAIPFSTAYSGSSSSQAVEDDEILSNARYVFGDLLKAVLLTREWVAGLRDLMYNCSINAILRENEESALRQITTFSELKEHLRAGEMLTLAAYLEETQLKKTIENTEKLIEGTKKIIKICLKTAIKNKMTDNDENENYSFSSEIQASDLFFNPTPLINEVSRTAWNGIPPEETYGAGGAFFHPAVQMEEGPDLKCVSQNELQGGVTSLYPRELRNFKLYGVMQVANRLLMQNKERVKRSLQNFMDSGNGLSLQENNLIEEEESEKPSFKDVKKLLDLAATHPIKINELSYVNSVFRSGLILSDFANKIITRGKQLLNTKSKAVLEKGKYSFTSIRKLCSQLQDFPWILEEEGLLLELVDRATVWQQQVRAMKPEDSPPEEQKTYSDPNKKSTRSGAKKPNSSGSKTPKPVALKQVEILMSEGERFPFDFKYELDILKEKKQQAKMWLDRLKKSFVPTKGGSNRLKKGENASDAKSDNGNKGKLTLQDMRHLVSEGECLFQPTEANSSSNATEGVKTGKTSNRELDRAMHAVEIADSWISRVRDIFVSNEEEDADPDSDEQAIQEKQKDDIRLLKELIEEADSMPVAMEEAQVLRCHMNALEWASKVKRVLVVGDSSQQEEEELNQKDRRRKSSKPRLSELQQFAKEILKIRSAVSDDILEEFPIKPLPQEEQCLNLVSEAENWLNKVKKITQGSNVRKGLKLHRLRQLHDEGKNIPVDFENELRPLRGAIEAAELWVNENRVILAELGILLDDVPTPTENEITEKPENSVGNNSVGPIIKAPKKAISYADLLALVNSSSHLLVEFDSLRAAKQLQSEAEIWLKKVSEIKNKTLENEEKPNNSVETILKPDERPIKRTKQETTAFDILVENLDFYLKKPLKPLISEKDLNDLLVQADTLKLDFIGEKQELVQVLTKCGEWGQMARNFIISSFPTDLKHISENYRKILYTNPVRLGFKYLVGCEELISNLNNTTSSGLNIETEINQYRRLLQVTDTVVQLQKTCEKMGFEREEYRVLNLFLGGLKWVLEVRCILSGNRKTFFSDGKIDKIENITEENLVKHPMEFDFPSEWGDISLQKIQKLEDEFGFLMKSTGNQEKTYNHFTNFENTIFSKVYYSLAPLEIEEKSEEKVIEDESQEDNKTEDTPGDLFEDEPLIRSTRAASGIVKRKTDHPDYATMSLGPGGKRSKTQKEESPAKVEDNGVKKVSAGKKRKLMATVEETEEKPEKIEKPTIKGPDTTFSRKTIINQCLQKLSPEAKSLPLHLVQLLEFWNCALMCFRVRVKEAQDWENEAQILLQKHVGGSPGFSVSKGFGEEAERLLDIAEKKGFFIKTRSILHALIINSKNWLQKAYLVVKNPDGNGLLTMDEQKEFISLGEQTIYEERNELLTILKTEYKKAKMWKTKFEKSGFDTGTASNEQLDDLVNEANGININLSEFTDLIQQVSKTYCLCRQLYFGQMVGCDTCEEWYHFQCVGLSPNQADKCDQYICIRCALMNSFSQSAHAAAKITNKWMHCSDHFKGRDNNMQKIIRRVAKEQKELTRLLAVPLPTQLSNTSTSSAPLLPLAPFGHQPPPFASIPTSTPTDVLPSQSTSQASTATNTQGNVQQQSDQLHRQILQAKVSLDRSVEEKRQLLADIALESDKAKQIVYWMQAVQEILWPSSELEASLGRPLGPAPAAPLPAEGFLGAGLPTLGSGLGCSSNSGGTNSTGAGVVLGANNSTGSISAFTNLNASASIAGAAVKPLFGAINSTVVAGMNSLADNPFNTSNQVGEGTGSSGEDQFSRYPCVREQVWLLKNLTELLPTGMVRMEQVGGILGIHTVEDVLLCIDAFRWMNWCNLSLHLLRSPPTTTSLRLLLEVSRSLRITDEKIIKLISGILQKACMWKAKARKLLATHKKFDFIKLNQIVLEGNSLPFTSRLKLKLKSILQKILLKHPNLVDKAGNYLAPAAAEAPLVSVEGDNNSVTGGTSVAGSIAPVVGKKSKILGSDHYAVNSLIRSSLAAETYSNSSDEEDEVLRAHRNTSQRSTIINRSRHTVASLKSLPQIEELYKFENKQTWADLPPSLWPVKLGVNRQKVVTNAQGELILPQNYTLKYANS